MLRRTGVAAVALAMLAGAAFAADVDKAEKLVRIGDYAAAVAQLHTILTAEPENVDARLLMARAFAECRYDLQLPGAVKLGRRNLERALYQLNILAKLGAKGEKALVEAIGQSARLRYPAVLTAGSAKLVSAVPALAKVLDSPDAEENTSNAAVNALVQIRTPAAVTAIKKHLDGAQDRNRKQWLTARYLDCLDEGAVVELAKATKDQEILRQLSYRRSLPQGGWLALVRRTDLSDDRRTRALDRLQNMAKTEKEKYVGLLEELLRDKSDEVRWAAEARMAGTAPERAMKPLIARLAREQKHAHDAFRTLLNMKNAAVIEPMLKVLGDKCDEKRYKTWWISRDRAYSVIVSAGAKDEPLVRAVRLMLQPDPASPRFHRPGYRPPLNLPRSIPKGELANVVSALLADEKEDVRLAAARALQSLPTDDLLKLAPKALGDKNAGVQAQAGRAVVLRARREPVAPKHLIPLLKIGDSFVVRESASLLAAKPDKAALEAMLALLNDPKRRGDAMSHLVAYFTAVPDARAVKPLATVVVSDRPPSPVEPIAKALRKCAKDIPPVAKQIAQGLKHKSEYVRRNVVTALKALDDISVVDELGEALDKAKSTYERNMIKDALRSLTREE